MSTLIVIGYPDETTADKVWEDLKKAESDYIVDLDNAAVIIHHENGKFDVHTGYHIVGTQTTWGFFWGALFGLLFFVPMFGMAIGAGMGVIMGAIEKSSIDKQFIDKVRDQVVPGYLGAVHGPAQRHAGQVHGHDRALRRHRPADVALRGGREEVPGRAARAGGLVTGIGSGSEGGRCPRQPPRTVRWV